MLELFYIEVSYEHLREKGCLAPFINRAGEDPKFGNIISIISK